MIVAMFDMTPTRYNFTLIKLLFKLGNETANLIESH